MRRQDRERRRSHRLLPRAEGLESRSLLSAGLGGRGGAPLPPSLQFSQPEYSVSQFAQVATINLTMHPSPRPVTATFSTAATSAAGVNFQPVQETVTFQPGETSKTVTVPITPGGPNAGEVDVPLNLSTQPGARRPSRTATLQILNRADVVSPQIVSTQLTRQGLALTFSEPMDPASVTDPRKYVVTEQDSINGSDVVNFLFLGQTPSKTRVPIRSVTYDPTTNTATLVPAQRLSVSADYQVSSATPRVLPNSRPHRNQAQPIEDASANIINGMGIFQVPVSRQIWFNRLAV